MSQDNAKSNRGPFPGTPRWVKVLAVIAVGLVVLFIVLHLTGNSFGGDHMAMIRDWFQNLWR
jgi:hypothetical protein